MPTKTISLLRGRRIRVTRLDGCGRPVYGEFSSVTSGGSASVALTTNSTDTEEVNVVDIAGDTQIFEPSRAKLTGYAVQVDFWEVDPDLFGLMTGQRTIVDAFGNVVGFEPDTAVDTSNLGYALEVWAGAPNSDACTVEGSEGNFGYILLPFVTAGMLGDFTIEGSAVTFSVTNSNTRDGNAWGVGPYSDVQLTSAGVPGPLVQAVSPTAPLRLMRTEVAPPAPAVGLRPLLNPTNAEITDISYVATGLDVDFTVTPISTGPVWWDFGDGEWDYVVAPGDASHTYDEAGTYTVRASQNGKWHSETITV